MNFSLPLHGSRTCVYFGAGRTHKQAMYGTEPGTFPAPAPSSRRETAGKQGMGGGRRGGNLSPDVFWRFLACIGLVGRSGQCLGAASPRLSRRRQSPGIPRGLAEWKNFTSSSKKEKLFLHLITPAAARRASKWVGLGVSKGGFGALFPNPTTFS